MRVRLTPILVPLLTLGCSSPQPIRAWQNQLTEYTMKQGNGDLNILRETAELRSTQTLRPAQIRFDRSALASGSGSNRKDVRGVMVGQQLHNNHPTFFFVVGVVDPPTRRRPAQTEDIRLLACTVRDGAHHWKVSEKDGSALAHYVRSRQEREQASTERARDLAFPAVDDDFQFELRNGIAKATETRSGAGWHLSLD